MKKLIILSIICSFLFFNSQAQGPINGFKVGGGLSVVIPASNLKNYSVGVGLDLLAHYGITSQFAITGDVGYTTLFPKEEDANSFNIIPIRGGIRFYPSNNLYLGGKAGVGIMTMKDFPNQNAFAYALGGGFRMDDKLDIGLNYEGLSRKENNIKSSLGYISLRLGYFFN